MKVRIRKEPGYVELCSGKYLDTGTCSGKVNEFLRLWVKVPQAKSREGFIRVNT